MKKKYILWVLLLTAVVATPPIYQRLSEAHRLKQIKTVKHEASQINAVPLNDFLMRLEATAPEETLLVLYTGSTHGHLEPCGCFIGQSGGLPRRATAIASLRATGLSPLLVDLGGILPTQDSKMSNRSMTTAPIAETEKQHPLDQLRTQKVLDAMQVLKYDAIVPDKADLKFGEDFLKDTLAHQPFPILTPAVDGLDGNTQSVLTRTLGDKKVAVFGLSSLWFEDTLLDQILPEIQDQYDLLVLLSNLPPEINRKIASNYPSVSAILSHGTGDTERVGNVLLAYSGTNGETLGALLLNVEDSLGVSAQQIALTEDVKDDTDIRELLQDFYTQVATDPQLQAGGERLFDHEALEQDARSAYVGSKACATCHQKEFDQWAHTSHATALNTLLTVGKQFYPECVTCHVTGFQYETGYQIGNSETEHLADVGCETCHGPGKQHITTPLTTNIRGEVENQVCMECHTATHSPGFDEIIEYVRLEVDHSRTDPTLKDILEQRMRGPMKPQVELFVMSYCPFGVQAEEELLPFIAKYGDAVDFNLRFIANLVEHTETDEETETDTLKFTSLHGETEVIENLRQIAVAQLYPDQFFDYLLCRAKHLKSAWTECAEKLGLDIGKVSQAVDSEEIKQLFVSDIQRATALGIQSSPTLVVDGKVISQSLWRGKVSGICR